ncbi:MAG: hypothetical protein R3245_08965 [Kiloniellales bacterium]|nr:hypothetical protein [Kiloniellales bacterium]
MHVIQPLGKELSYGIQFGPFGSPYLYLPPWRGPKAAVARPTKEGHFDHLSPGTPEFEAAHIYGTVRFVLDVWERYFGETINWHFRSDYDQLEIVILPGWDNAQMGYGFLEVGGDFDEEGEYRSFGLNFDVIAHEVGHGLIYSWVGVPNPDTEYGEYFGFHESAADVVALLASLHFETVLDDLLLSTSGNLYTLNKLNRIMELSENRQIRLAANSSRLGDFAGGWHDEHHLSEPLTGAIFDILVDVFHENLLDQRLITAELEDLADQVQYRPEYDSMIQVQFDDAFAANPAGFRQALVRTRDIMGKYLADSWLRISPDYLNYIDVADALLDVDRDMSGGRYRRLIINAFRSREIGVAAVGPRLSEPTNAEHAFSARTVLPELRTGFPAMSFCERWEVLHEPERTLEQIFQSDLGERSK